MSRTRPWDPANGLPWETVVVRGIDLDAGVAQCENHIGKVRNIPLSVQRARGVLPRVGERWAIDRTLGQWTFAGVLNPSPPTLLGDRSDGTALANLISLLEDAGLLVDGTTA